MREGLEWDVNNALGWQTRHVQLRPGFLSWAKDERHLESRKELALSPST